MNAFLFLLLLFAFPGFATEGEDSCADELVVRMTYEQEQEVVNWVRISAIVFQRDTASASVEHHLKSARQFWTGAAPRRASLDLQPGIALRVDTDSRHFLIQGLGRRPLLYGRVPEGQYGHKSLFLFFHKLQQGLRLGVGKRATDFKSKLEREDHCRRHGPSVRDRYRIRLEEAFTCDDYVSLAREFALSKHPLTFSIETPKGEFIKIHPVSREFLVLDRDGHIRTYHLFDPELQSINAIHRGFRKLFEAAVRD